jgi:DNA-damage-inducible protein J
MKTSALVSGDRPDNQWIYHINSRDGPVRPSFIHDTTHPIRFVTVDRIISALQTEALGDAYPTGKDKGVNYVEFVVHLGYNQWGQHIRGDQTMPKSKAAAKTGQVKARIDPILKAETEAIFEKLGLSSSDAIRLFYTHVKNRKGLPFDVRLPNATTRKAMRDADAGKVIRYENVADMAATWRAEDGEAEG